MFSFTCLYSDCNVLVCTLNPDLGNIFPHKAQRTSYKILTLQFYGRYWDLPKRVRYFNSNLFLHQLFYSKVQVLYYLKNHSSNFCTRFKCTLRPRLQSTFYWHQGTMKWIFSLKTEILIITIAIILYSWESKNSSKLSYFP